MESVIDKMRELEQKEKDVEKAREEAANGGSEITAKVEKLKQTVAQAIEENDMVGYFLSCLDTIWAPYGLCACPFQLSTEMSSSSSACRRSLWREGDFSYGNTGTPISSAQFVRRKGQLYFDSR